MLLTRGRLMIHKSPKKRHLNFIQVLNCWPARGLYSNRSLIFSFARIRIGRRPMSERDALLSKFVATLARHIGMKTGVYGAYPVTDFGTDLRFRATMADLGVLASFG
uniref:Uncharacterized protein n=1 Tax=Romanomermis culicivorax TaxID=13658 RepID=A0A915L680_ROMCU